MEATQASIVGECAPPARVIWNSTGAKKRKQGSSPPPASPDAKSSIMAPDLGGGVPRSSPSSKRTRHGKGTPTYGIVLGMPDAVPGVKFRTKSATEIHLPDVLSRPVNIREKKNVLPRICSRTRMGCFVSPPSNPSATSRCGSLLLSRVLLTCALLMTSSHAEGQRLR